MIWWWSPLTTDSVQVRLLRHAYAIRYITWIRNSFLFNYKWSFGKCHGFCPESITYINRDLTCWHDTKCTMQSPVIVITTMQWYRTSSVNKCYHTYDHYTQARSRPDCLGRRRAALRTPHSTKVCPALAGAVVSTLDPSITQRPASEQMLKKHNSISGYSIYYLEWPCLLTELYHLTYIRGLNLTKEPTITVGSELRMARFF